jgi:hypothetical protein
MSSSKYYLLFCSNNWFKKQSQCKIKSTVGSLRDLKQLELMVLWFWVFKTNCPNGQFASSQKFLSNGKNFSGGNDHKK